MKRLLFKIFYNLLITFVLFVAHQNYINAQQTRIIYTHFDTNNGLASDNVESIITDKEGFIWIGTTNGFQCFNGYSFDTYLPNSNDSTSISDTFITNILEDKWGNIWIGTSNKGLNLFDKQNESFYRFRHGTNRNSLSGDIIPRFKKSITHGSKGYIWVNTDKGLNKIHVINKTVERYFGDFNGHLIHDSTENVLWIFNEGIKRFEIKSQKLDYYSLNSNQSNKNNTINAVIKDKKGIIWLGTNRGIYIFDKKSRTSHKFINYMKSLGKNTINYQWSTGSITAIYEDYKGDIWFASGNSIFILNKSNGTYSTLSHETDNPNSLKDFEIEGISGNKSGVIWVFYSHGGLSKLNIKTKKFMLYNEVFGKDGSVSSNPVRSIYKDKRGDLWVSILNHGLTRMISKSGKTYDYRHHPDNIKTINSDIVTALFIDSSERLWVGTFKKGFCYAENIYNSKEIDFNRIGFKKDLEAHEFTEDISGKIWVSTQNGFYIYDPGNNKTAHYGDSANHHSEVKNLNVQSVLYDAPNNFWLACWNGGVCKLTINSDSLLSKNIAKDELTIYSDLKDENNSKINNRFITIFRGQEENIWIGSLESGLVKMELNGNEPVFKMYDKSKGAPDNTVFGIAGDQSGNIWISTNNGIGKFNPETEEFRNYTENDGLQSNSFIWDASFQSKNGQIFFGGINGLTTFYPDSIIDNTILPKVFISKLSINNKEVQIGEKFNKRVILKKNIRFTEEIVLSNKESVFSLEFIALDNYNRDEVLFEYMLEGFDKQWVRTDSKIKRASYTNLDAGTYYFKVKASNSDGIWNNVPAVLKIKVLPPWWLTWWAYSIYTILIILALSLSRKLVLLRAKLKNEILIEHLERKKEAELNQSKLKFFTNISHEFRTPLTLILGPLEKIISSDLGQEDLNRQYNVM